jgi:hypothetical protein
MAIMPAMLGWSAWGVNPYADDEAIARIYLPC